MVKSRRAASVSWRVLRFQILPSIAFARNPRTMSNNNFKPRKFEDFEIVDPEGLVVGHIRVKPSGVLWARANSKVWHGVGLKRFAQFMEAKGRKQKK